MAQDADKRKLTEEELYFYEEQICAEADLVYRFCVALTLSQESGVQLLRATYRQIANVVHKLMGKSGSELKTALLKQAFVEAKNTKQIGGGDSALFNYLKKQSLDLRAIITAKEVVGLSIAQIAQVIGESEDNVMMKLAIARRDLCASMGKS